MIRRKSLKSLLLMHLLFEFTLTLISSIHWILFVISFIIYFFLMLKEKNEFDLFSMNYLSSIIFIFFHFIAFTLSYAEILPWEIFLICLLIILIIYYNKRLSLLTNKSYIDW